MAFNRLRTLRSMACLALSVSLCLGLAFPSLCQASTLRLKDITHVKGVRNNQLIGYGLVVGLNKTGDKSRSTQNAQWNLIQNMGGRLTNENDIRGTNTAAVMVTALVPPFAKPGDAIDIVVSSMADAKSLEGGVLISTQLMAPNGEVVALAQGPVSTGGVSVDSNGSSRRTAITTSGRIPGGAIVEREIFTEIGDANGIDLVLDRTDFTMTQRIADTISKQLAPAKAVDGSMVRVALPDAYADNRVAFLARLENLMVNNEVENAKVVVNERTGTIVIGKNVRLLPAAVAHGGIAVSVNTTNSVSQPGELSIGGQAVGVSNSTIQIEKQPGSLIELNTNSTLSDLVTALNSIGATPNDLISILQALKAAGSLEATLEII